MSVPPELSVGTNLLDEASERWMIRRIDPGWVTVQHPELGAHRLRRSDLEAWIAADRWVVLD